MTELHFFGIRHHGPGSARSLVRALQAVRPDVVLIEGPPDANDLLPLAAHAGLEPPVALLVYLPDRPRAAVLYPFARFSPEWQAIRYGLAHAVPLRFIDLPQSLRFGAAEAETGEGAKRMTTRSTSPPRAAIRWRRWRWPPATATPSAGGTSSWSRARATTSTSSRPCTR